MADELLRVEGLEKSFGDTHVLRGLDFQVRRGEFVTLLGPSGCGKTTTLRILSGLLNPDAGRIFLGGADITCLPPEKRNLNTVFQNYALFPHMNVEANISYGLRARGMNRRQCQPLVEEMLRLVRLEGKNRRMPRELSGGQCQRVAIARAVVLRPALLLLDEPLGALDLKLRRQMQTELKDIQKRLGIAFLYITHDQEEALNMSDRIAVMNGGRFEQVGTPQQVYDHPETRFVADFIGQTNLLPCRVEEVTNEGTVLSYGGVRFPGRPCAGGAAAGEQVLLSLRTERLRLTCAPRGGCALRGRITERRFVGGSMRDTLCLADGRGLTVLSEAAGSRTFEVGEEVFVEWSVQDAPVVRA